MRSDYTKAAHERTGVSILQRMVLDRFMRSDSPPKEVALCEEVFVGESQLPQEAWQEILEKLVIWENDARTRMSEYRWKKEETTLPFLGKRPETRNARPEPKKPKRKRKTEQGPEGGGSPAG